MTAPMLDFHTHILPEMDDGSESAAMSLGMLTEMYENGIDMVYATPHYYADEETVDEFLARRAESFEKLRRVCEGKNVPEIRLGAEVHLTDTLTARHGLDRLCIEGTNLMLIEPPYTAFLDSTFGYIEHILSNYFVVPVIAHIDRYLFLQTKKTLNRLFEMELLFQTNAKGILDKKLHRTIIKMIKKGMVQFVGSDCHNATVRPPDVHLAYQVLKKKMPAAKYEQFLEFCNTRGDL